MYFFPCLFAGKRAVLLGRDMLGICLTKVLNRGVNQNKTFFLTFSMFSTFVFLSIRSLYVPRRPSPRFSVYRGTCWKKKLWNVQIQGVFNLFYQQEYFSVWKSDMGKQLMFYSFSGKFRTENGWPLHGYLA